LRKRRASSHTSAKSRAAARSNSASRAGHLQLEVRQIRHAAPPLGSPPGIYAAMPRDALILGAHADRIALGSTMSSHRSTSSAPST
jgi:hypothetical protein